MRKNVFGRQLKRDKNERKALFKSLLSSLVIYEKIQTTEAKAKAVKASADKLITKAKKGGLHAYRLIEPELTNEAAKKLLNTIAPLFATRQGGYTRIIRVGKRVKDNAQEVILEWTEMPVKVKQKTAKLEDVKIEGPKKAATAKKEDKAVVAKEVEKPAKIKREKKGKEK